MGEAEDTQLARTSLLTSSREWKGNGVSHDARKDVKLTADAAARILILISQRWQVAADGNGGRLIRGTAYTREYMVTV